jgi:NAD(P)-dependent dehydrogenase (short-subunit alcohol dehydrogenase family)
MLPASPRVVIVEGLGVFTFGKDSRAATISADIYDHTVGIIESAERLGGYKSLSASDAFDAEYWPLELYKLTLAPAEKSLSRKVALVTGAVGAIGSAIARRFMQEGAHVVCSDLDGEGAIRLSGELNATKPANNALGIEMDVTREDSVLAAFHSIKLEYGGVDIVVSNAGIAHGAPIEDLELEEWSRSLAVNATGHFLVAREAIRIMKTQGLGGSLVFIGTKNVPAPGKEFGAYSAAKAAEVQLARVLALEAGSYGIRSNIINPDAVFAGSGLWSDDLRDERARAHGIAPGDLEEFYRARNILTLAVRAEDVAEAALFFASDRSSRTTGAMLPVDGGLREAFPR